MVFKPNFNCFKDEKVNFIQDSKAINFTLSEYIYIILSHSKFIERFRLKQKKMDCQFKKTCQMLILIELYINFNF